MLEPTDTAQLTELLGRNREFLCPWDPLRGDDFFTVEKQTDITRIALDAYSAGTMVPMVILNSAGAVAGRLTINGIVRGAFESAVLGYWVSENENGLGLATAAVAEAVEFARTQLGLHRLQAETLPHNVASRKVLEKNGFSQYGVAPAYLKIAGRWQDCVLFQRILTAST